MTTPFTNKELVPMSPQIAAIFGYITTSNLESYIADRLYDGETRRWKVEISMSPWINGRERGFVLTVRDAAHLVRPDKIVHYVVYEHRNSDSICVIRESKAGLFMNFLTPDMLMDFKTKYDYTKEFANGQINESVEWIGNDITDSFA